MSVSPGSGALDGADPGVEAVAVAFDEHLGEGGDVGRGHGE
ncbi:hypothetical protein [Frankia umida]|nr:hypothetical protein [Frankia umida]